MTHASYLSGIVLIVLCEFGLVNTGFSHPRQPPVQSLPHADSVLVYEDSFDPQKFYAIPRKLEFLKGEDGGPRFAVKHWGLSSPDWRGAGAIAKFTIQPRVLNSELDEILKALQRQRPRARLVFPNASMVRTRVIINGSYFERQQNTTLPVGGTPNSIFSPQEFSILLTRLGARVFTQGIADPNHVIALAYEFRVAFLVAAGQQNLEAIADVCVHCIWQFYHSKNVYKVQLHDWLHRFRFFLEKRYIILEIKDGADQDPMVYAEPIFQRIWGGESKLTNSSPDVPSSMASFRDVDSYWIADRDDLGITGDHRDPQDSRRLVISSASLHDQRFELADSFSVSCGTWPGKFENLSDSSKRCISPDDLRAVAREVQRCVDLKVSWYKMLFNEGLIDRDLLQVRIEEVIDSPCYGVSDKLKEAMDRSHKELQHNHSDLTSGKITTPRWKEVADHLSDRVISIP